MNRPPRTIEIDRITLTGLDVTPDRAELIRSHVESELRHRLQRERLPRGFPGGRVDHLHAPEMHLAAPHSDGAVAGALAGSIFHALRAAGSARGG